MRKLRNAVFGIALGDALGSRAQRKNFTATMSNYGDEEFSDLDDSLAITEHTESGLYLVKALSTIYDPTVPVSSQRTIMAEYIARSYIDWKNETAGRGHRDRASIQALNKLENLLADNIGSTNFFGGAASASKSSQPMIRSLWLGILHAKGMLTDGELEELCTLQTAVTHTNPTVIHASFISAIVLSGLYTEYIQPGEIQHYLTKLCISRDEDYGWSEIFHALENILELETSQVFMFEDIEDPATVLGAENNVETTLAHAVMIADALYPDPNAALKRGVLNGGASGSISSLAGAWIGAMNRTNVWSGLEHVLTEPYREDLEVITDYLSSI